MEKLRYTWMTNDLCARIIHPKYLDLKLNTNMFRSVVELKLSFVEIQNIVENVMNSIVNNFYN